MYFICQNPRFSTSVSALATFSLGLSNFICWWDRIAEKTEWDLLYRLPVRGKMGGRRTFVSTFGQKPNLITYQWISVYGILKAKQLLQEISKVLEFVVSKYRTKVQKPTNGCEIDVKVVEKVLYLHFFCILEARDSENDSHLHRDLIVRTASHYKQRKLCQTFDCELLRQIILSSLGTWRFTAITIG